MPKLRPVLAAQKTAGKDKNREATASAAAAAASEATRGLERLEVNEDGGKSVASQLGDIVSDYKGARQQHSKPTGAQQRPKGPRPNDPGFVDDSDVPPLM